jgi:hypothetical protein
MAAHDLDFRAHYLTTGRFFALVVVAVSIFVCGDILRQRDVGSSRAVLPTLLAASLIAYVVGLRPAVLEDMHGVSVRNPLRTTVVPWGSVRNVDVVDVLRVHTADQVVRCFAVPRRRPRAPRLHPLGSPMVFGGGAGDGAAGGRGRSAPRGFGGLGAPGAGYAGSGPRMSRAEAIAGRLREQAGRFAHSTGTVDVTFARDAVVALAGAAVLLGLAAVLA